MTSQAAWSRNMVVWGVVCLALGVAMGGLGLLLPGLSGALGISSRIVPAIGIVLVGLGIAGLGQYAYIRRHPKAGQQMLIEERDERKQWIRARAGLSAFWVSTSLAYALLLWVSFQGNRSVPKLSEDALWLWLAVIVVVPFLVFAARIVYEEQHH